MTHQIDNEKCSYYPASTNICTCTPTQPTSRDSIETVVLNGIEVQQNGIVRNSKGRLIARLVDSCNFEGEHIKGLSNTPMEKAEGWEEAREILFEFWKGYTKAKISGGDRDEVIEKYVDTFTALLASHEAACRADERRKVVEELVEYKEHYKTALSHCLSLEGGICDCDVDGYNWCLADLRAKLTGLDEK